MNDQDEGSSVVKVCVCVSLTLLISLDFGKCSIPVEDEPVEAELVVQGLLRILQQQSKTRINNQLCGWKQPFSSPNPKKASFSFSTLT